jgi:hypothetical protein
MTANVFARRERAVAEKAHEAKPLCSHRIRPEWQGAARRFGGVMAGSIPDRPAWTAGGEPDELRTGQQRPQCHLASASLAWIAAHTYVCAHGHTLIASFRKPRRPSGGGDAALPARRAPDSVAPGQRRTSILPLVPVDAPWPLPRVVEAAIPPLLRVGRAGSVCFHPPLPAPRFIHIFAAS